MNHLILIGGYLDEYWNPTIDDFANLLIIFVILAITYSKYFLRLKKIEKLTSGGRLFGT